MINITRVQLLPHQSSWRQGYMTFMIYAGNGRWPDITIRIPDVMRAHIRGLTLALSHEVAINWAWGEAAKEAALLAAKLDARHPRKSKVNKKK